MKKIAYKQRYECGKNDDSREILMAFVNDHIAPIDPERNKYDLRLDGVRIDTMDNRTAYQSWGSYDVTYIKMKVSDADYRDVVRKVAIKDGQIDLDEVKRKYQELLDIRAAAEKLQAQRRDTRESLAQKRAEIIKQAGYTEETMTYGSPLGADLTIKQHDVAELKLSLLTHDQARVMLETYRKLRQKGDT